MKRRIFQITCAAILVILVFGFSGCSKTSSEEPAQTDENTVLIQDFKFQPAEITIKSGETITWINKDSVKHTATGDSFDSGLLAKDASFQQTFDTAGTYDYICTPHPYMEGKVIVE